MKKLITLVFVTVVFAVVAHAQLRCIAENRYTRYSKDGDHIVNQPVSICYSNNIFSFFTNATGTRTFEISDRTTEKNKDGFVVERFLNTEGDKNLKGDYHVEITYGLTKVVLISFTRFGEAYLVQSKRFIGSPGQNSSTKSLVKRIKTGRAEVAKSAESLIDVQKWFFDNSKLTFNKGRNDIKCQLLISNTGEVSNVVLESAHTSATGTDKEINNGIIETLKGMPLWKPAVDAEGHNVESSLQIRIQKD